MRSIFTPREPFTRRTSPRSIKFPMKRAGLRGRREKFCLRGGMAGFDGAANETFRVTLHADNPVEFPGRRSRAPGLAMQFGGSGTELQHFAGGENVPACRAACS